ncbi:MAG: hypothetical protein IPL70_13890 [Uliginosibacterium sp.]|nr:hypothetical protein [Uliginosibacterium sp.]
MANELLISYPTGATLYALLFDATGQVWNGSAFAAPGSAAWTDYDIAMSEVATATGIYRASMPAAAAGVYGWVVRKQAGGSPAVGDIAVGVGRIEWNGTAEIVPGGAAVGTYSYSNTVDDGSGNLLDGVFIQCATDTGFTNIVSTTHTNSLGAFTVYSDIAGTHYLKLQLAGYSFTIQTVTLA